MKRLSGMKTQNKKMLVIAVSVVCLMAGFSHISQASAAQEDELDLITMGFDPFNLTTYELTDTNLRGSGGDLGTTGDVVPLSTVNPLDLEGIAKPFRIWLPKRPDFRSPCTPSW